MFYPTKIFPRMVEHTCITSPVLHSAIMRQGKYWQIGLSPRIGGELFCDFGFKSKDTKLVRKYWLVKYWLMAVDSPNSPIFPPAT